MGERRRESESMLYARSVLPEKYHPHLIELKGKPYVNVDGRTLMALDDAKERGEQLSVHTEPCDVFGQPCIKATVTIGNRTTTGIASIHFGGTGADATNPIETGETSAVGRALGFLGYGLLGHGIASADEMQGALNRQANGSSTPPPAPSTDKPPSDRQQAFLRDLWDQLGTSEADIEKNVASITTAQEASEMIGALQQALRDKAKPSKEKSTQIKEVTALIAYAEQHNMMDRLQGMKLEHLTAATAKEMHESLRKDVAEHFATEGAKQARDPWLDEQDAQADAEAQEDMGFSDRVPNMARRAH